MTNAIEEVDQDTLSTIERHAGLGMALGIAIAIAGVLAVISPLIAGLSVTIAVGVLLIVSGASRLFLAFKMGSFKCTSPEYAGQEGAFVKRRFMVLA